MKLHTRDSFIVSTVALSLLMAACGSKNSDDDSGSGTGGLPGNSVGGANASQGSVGGANASQGGVSNDATGGRAETGGRRSTGGSTSNSATAASGGAVISNLPKACPGFPYDDSTTGADGGGACRGDIKEIEPSQFDIMIAMDRTMSMTYCLDGRRDVCGPDKSEPSRWQILEKSLQQFLTNIAANMTPANQPRMGLRFFGNTGNPDDAIECLASTYAVPQVAMQDFATASAAISEAMNIMGSKGLGGQTPWQPALHGVLQYAQDWQKNHMERITVVLFVTDGFATECVTSSDVLQNTVGEFFWGLPGDYNTLGKPGVRTYIMGVGGDFDAATRYNLDNIAYAGGTGQATIANNTTDVDSLSLTMQNITNSNVSCEFALPAPPDGMILDKDKVQVIYAPFKGDKQEIGATGVSGAAGACSTANGGWYYDNPSDPKKVILCPCSCANLGAGRITVQYGCRPKPIIG